MERENEELAQTEGAQADSRLHQAVRFLCGVADVTSAMRMPGLLVDAFAQRCLGGFCNLCAIQALDDDGRILMAALAEGPGSRSGETTTAFAAAARDLEGAIYEAMRTRLTALYSSAAGRTAAEASAARLLRATESRSLIVVPLTIGARVAGSVSFLEARRLVPFDALDVTCAVAAVRQLGSALEVVEARASEQSAIERSRLRARATDQLFTTVNQREMLRRLLSVLAEDFADCALAVSLDHGVVDVLARVDRRDDGGDTSLPPTGAAFGTVSEAALLDSLRSRRPVLMNRIARAGLPGLPQSESAEVRSWMTVPFTESDASFGGIACYSLRQRYTEPDLELLEEICRRTSLALEFAGSFERERRLTQTLQQATLPSNLAEVPGAVLSAIYIPAAQEEQVGGDWYDAFSLDDYRVLVTVGDVTGHGLQASVIMAKLRHALNVVAMYETNPATVLDIAERIVLRRYPNALATAFVAIVDTRAGTLSYANAGHPPPIVRLKDGSCLPLVADGLPVGVRYMESTKEHGRRELDGIELMFMYTDGMTEYKRTPIQGEACLRSAVAHEVATIVSDSASFVRTVCLEGPLADDVAALSLNFADLQRWRFASGDGDSAQNARREFRDALRSRAQTEEQCVAAELVFGELLANVVRHAPGNAEVALDMRTERAVLHVVDQGPGYAARAARGSDVLSEAGRGLWLVDRLGAKVTVNVIPRFGTHTRAVLPGALVST